MSMDFVFDRKDAHASSYGRRSGFVRRSDLQSDLLMRGLAAVACVILALPVAALAVSFFAGGVTTMETLFFTMLGIALQAPVVIALLLASAAGLAAWQVLWLAELARSESQDQARMELDALAAHAVRKRAAN